MRTVVFYPPGVEQPADQAGRGGPPTALTPDRFPEDRRGFLAPGVFGDRRLDSLPYLSRRPTPGRSHRQGDGARLQVANQRLQLGGFLQARFELMAFRRSQL